MSNLSEFRERKNPIEYLEEAKGVLSSLILNKCEWTGDEDYAELCMAQNYINLYLNFLEKETLKIKNKATIEGK